MNKKYILGLVLIIGLLALPGVSAQGHPGGTMPAPTSSSGITACGGCHGNVGSPTTAGFCTGCHGFPTFTLRVLATPTSITAGTATPVEFTVRNGPTNGPKVAGALVSLSGAGVPTGTSGTTVSTGLTTISVNAGSSGIITATASKTASYINGTTTLSASAPGKTLTSISVTPASPTITQGQNQQFVATGTYSDSTTAVITNSVTWSSSNNSVATIGTSTGLAASVSSGTTQITATLNGITSPARTLTVQAPGKTLTSISVTPASPTITQGQNQQFVATGTYSDSTTAVITNSVTWSSSNNSVATIGTSTGLAASVSSGTTQIKATSGAVSGSATMTVTAPQTTGSVSVTFVVTDRVTGKPVDDAKVSMDGVKKETDDNGTVIFTNVSLRTHYYTVYEEHHAKFKGSIKVTGNTQIQVKLVPLVQKKKKQVHKD